jgi:peptide/nickel transport system substrate-binding protein
MSARDEIQDRSWPLFERPVTRRDVLKRGGTAALGLSFAGPLLAACGGAQGGGAQQAAEAAKTPGDTLVVAVEGDVDTFDPAFTVGSKPSQTTLQNVFDQLTQYKQVEKELAGITFQGVDTESIQGMLAESWEESGSSVVFTLREGITYHDGTPVTAKYIEEGYRRVFEAEGISYFLLSMAAVPDPDHIRALDDRRVEVRMDTENLLFFKNNTMHNTSAVNFEEAKERATTNDPWATEYFKKRVATGNGPFMFEEYRPGDRIMLRAYSDYYGGKPKLARVIQKIVPEATQRILLIKRGEVDMIMIPPVKELDALKEDPNLQVLTFPNPRNYMLEMNNAMPPFDKKEARQAVCYAVPYQNILEDVFRGYAQECKSIVGNGMPSSDFSSWKYDTDLDKAAELLAAAGFPNGEGAAPITITIRADWEEAERSAILIQANLNQLGLDASIQKLAFAQFNEQEQGRNLQCFIDEWLSWVNDPWYHMSWNVSSESPSNYTNYKNPQVDELVKKWTHSTDVEGRLEGSREAQALVNEDAPHAYLAGPNWNVVMRKNVRGYVYYNDELNRYAYMSKEA